MANLRLPNDLVLAITYNCNSKCRMCNIWKTEQMPVLDLAEYKKLPQNLKEVNITGGEPFLSPNLIEIIKILVNLNPLVRIIISTNGFATELIKTKMQEILKIKPDIGLGVSVDGIGAAHDQIRGISDGFDKVMATIKALQAMEVKDLRLAFTAGDYNILELNKVYKLAQELGVEFSLAAIHNADNYFNTVDNQINRIEDFKKEFRRLIQAELKSWNYKKWLRAYFAYALLRFIETKKRLLPNYSGRDNVFIDPLGDVYPADVSGHLMGNLKDFPNFKELYDSKRAQEAIALEKLDQNWMICTARSAIKRHPVAIIAWILKNKLWGAKL
ncbi:MAG: radical SAM protein [Patescibacteria group bacterium]